MARLQYSAILTICITVTAIAVLIATQVEARPGHDGHGHGCGHGGIFKGTCMNVTIVQSSQLTTANTTCRARLNLTSNAGAAAGAGAAAETEGKQKQNWHCLKSCILKEMGVISAADTLNTSGVGSFVDALYPEAARANLKTAIGACSTTPADPATTENSCGKTKSLEKCTMKAIFQVCKPSAAT